MIKTKHFCIGFRYPRTSSNQGIIYLDGEEFANTFQCHPDYKSIANKWTINRATKAFELKFEHDKVSEACFDSPQEMLNYLEEWYKKVCN
jgi:hypothetical protein